MELEYPSVRVDDERFGLERAGDRDLLRLAPAQGHGGPCLAVVGRGLARRVETAATHGGDLDGHRPRPDVLEPDSGPPALSFPRLFRLVQAILGEDDLEEPL